MGKRASKNDKQFTENPWWKRFYRPAEKILGLADRFRPAAGKEKEEQQFRELYISADYRERGRQEQIKQIAFALVFLLVTGVLVFAVEVKSLISRVSIKENSILRQEENSEVELTWEAGEEKGNITLLLKPQRIPPEDRDRMFCEAQEYITSYILGGNESLQAVRGGIRFPETVPGTEITVTCRPGSYHWLNADGSRSRNVLPESGATETLTITMRYYEEEREVTLELLLLPEETGEELLRKKVEEELARRAADNTGEMIHLPEEIEGVPVRWKVKKDGTGITLLFLGLFAAVCIPLAGKRRQEEQVQKREQELMEDYPELVSKYRLLLNAGLSQRGVWERIVLDYRKNGRKCYVYEEMLLTMREMENGISEARAYERFGKRCRLLPYVRFGGVLVQNLQKGAKGTLALLEQEAIAAFAERKAAAKRKGEETGTRLLPPMFVLLGLVLAIVMYPALKNL